MHTAYTTVLSSPIGCLGLVIDDADCLLTLDFLPAQVQPCATQQTTTVTRITQQLLAYFSDPNVTFNIPCTLHGTAFQRRVWDYLQHIPCGTTQTYTEIAHALNSGARAVGNACRHNPIPLIIPCHRVVARNGLGGYAGQLQGAGQQQKRWLLAHEKVLLKA